MGLLGETLSLVCALTAGASSNLARSTYMDWKNPTPDELMRMGLVALFILGLAATVLLLFLNLR